MGFLGLKNSNIFPQEKATEYRRQMVEVPQHLYRYRRLNEHTLNFLERGEVYFESPPKYNDPFEIDLVCEFRGAALHARDHFESFIRFEVDRVFGGALRSDDEPSLGYLSWIATQTAKAGDFEEIRAALNALPDDDIEGAKAVVDSFWNKRKEVYAACFGICCFSELPADPLMWAHYANNHKGICFIIDTRKRPTTDWKRFAYHKVAYEIERSIDVIAYGYGEAFLKMLLTKAECWKYEKEWRLISKHGPGKQFSSNQNVNGVILGLRVRDNELSLRKKLYKALLNFEERAPDPRSKKKPKRRSLTIRQIVKDQRKFLLKPVPVHDLKDALQL
jgi:hypothetical protein